MFFFCPGCIQFKVNVTAFMEWLHFIHYRLIGYLDLQKSNVLLKSGFICYFSQHDAVASYCTYNSHPPIINII